MKSVVKERKTMHELFVELGQTSSIFNRKTAVRLISLILLSFSIQGGLLPSIARSAEATAETDLAVQFQHAFVAADGKGKRDLVMKAIDSDLIHTGLTFSEMQKLFPDIQEAKLVEWQNRRVLTLYFEPIIPPPKPLMSATSHGWYIRLYFSPGKVLIDYSLSNVHRGISSH